VTLLPPATPALVVDLDTVTAQVNRIRAAFGDIDIHYAVKANPLPALLPHLAALGVSFDVASPAEVRMAVTAGADMRGVIYAHPVKPSPAIRSAARAGVRRFAVDTVSEAVKIGLQAPGSHVFVRLAVPAIDAAFPLTGKFGADPEHVPGIVAAAAAAGLTVDGISFHVGSQTTNAKAWTAAMEVTARVLADVYATTGLQLGWIDIGGGLPAPHPGQQTLDLADVAHTVREGAAGIGWPVRFACEPGRFLVAEAGTMFTSVIDIVERDGVRWVFLDTGIYHGLHEAGPDGRFSFPVTVIGAARPGPVTPAVLTGPTCDSSDRLAGTYPLPPLQEGDRLTIGVAGAYPIPNPFNGFDTPGQWVASGGRLHPAT
jgi:ornithine decarboxylase